MHTPQCVCNLEDNLWELVLSTTWVLGEKAQVVSKHLYLTSHFAGPHFKSTEILGWIRGIITI